MIPFLDLSRQRAQISEEIDRRIASVLDHHNFILGPEVIELEAHLSKRAGVQHCISCANGTDALQIALMGLGVGPGDEVIVPSFSYVATAETVALIGAIPVFVDVDPETCLIKPSAVEKALNAKTRAVIPVSLYGQCPEFNELKEILAASSIPLLEDAAQSFGATYEGLPSCGITKIATTSFFPSKPLGCYGDGGAIFTDDSDLAKVVREVARHGQTRRYHHVRIGVNSRLDTMQAAILLAKLTIFDDEIELRQLVAQRYDDAFSDLAVGLPSIRPGRKSAWAQYTLRLNNHEQREKLGEALVKQGIPTSIHYPLPLHRQPAFNIPADCPTSEKLSQTVLSLPFDPWMPNTDQERIIKAVRNVLSSDI